MCCEPEGWSGKTNTAVNLSSALSFLKKDVLLIDLDPQANASSGLGVRKDDQKGQIYHAFIGKKSLSDVIYPSKIEGLSVVPSNVDLVGVEVELLSRKKRELILKDQIRRLHKVFDYVLIDCPPSLGLLTLNALCAAQSFLVPLQCEYYALEGLSQLLHTAGLVRRDLNPNLSLEGILLTMYDSRNNLSRQVLEEVRSHFPKKVFKTLIPRNVRLSEAPSHGKSIFNYDNQSSGAEGYRAFAEEFLKKNPIQKEEESLYVKAGL